MVLRRLSIVVAVVGWADSSNGTDLPFNLGSAEVLAGNVIATGPGPAGLSRLAAGSLPGALRRQDAKGQPFGGALVSQMGENVTAMGASGLAVSFVGGGGIAGFATRQAVGLAAGSVGRMTFNEVINYNADPDYGSIGGLQAKLADLKSVNGMKSGIQQYDLLDKTSNPQRQPKQQSATQPLPRYDSGPLDPSDQVIGRVPDGSDAGGGFFDALVPSSRGCGGLDYTKRNPCEGF